MRWDDERPWCEHGRAHKQGHGKWACPLKSAERVRRYRHSEKGREARRRENRSDAALSSKALYDLTRVNVS